MLIAILTVLVLFDLVLSYIVWKQFSKPAASDQLLADIHLERQEISKIKQECLDEIAAIRSQVQEQFHSIKHLSAELDADIQDAPKEFKKVLEQAHQEFVKECDKPLSSLSHVRSDIEGSIKKAQRERKKIQGAIEHGEVIIQSLHNSRSWDDVISDIQDKKYDNARNLLAQGVPKTEVMQDLGLSHSEIQLL